MLAVKSNIWPLEESGLMHSQSGNGRKIEGWRRNIKSSFKCLHPKASGQMMKCILKLYYLLFKVDWHFVNVWCKCMINGKIWKMLQKSWHGREWCLPNLLTIISISLNTSTFIISEILKCKLLLFIHYTNNLSKHLFWPVLGDSEINHQSIN